MTQVPTEPMCGEERIEPRIGDKMPSGTIYPGRSRGKLSRVFNASAGNKFLIWLGLFCIASSLLPGAPPILAVLGALDIGFGVSSAVRRARTQAKKPKSGDMMPEGTVFAGISPDTNKPIYVMPAEGSVRVAQKSPNFPKPAP